MKKKICLILPAFNEEKTIKKTILLFHKEIPSAAICVINNNSSDKTFKIALSTLNKLKKKTLNKGFVINEFRQGKGSALRRAFLEIDSDVYVLADADLTYPAPEIYKLLDPILNNEADMVVGNRHANDHYLAQNKRLFHNFGNALVNKLVNYLFKINLKDIMSGYRALNRKFVKNYPILVDGFEIETDMTLHALDKRFRILEVPISYTDRPIGSESKLNTFRDGFKILRIIFNIFRHFRPMKFFGLLAIFFFVLGLVCGFLVIDEFINTGYIQHVPLAILAVGLELFAIILIAAALILDSINYQARFNFEHKLNE
jgi:glycosyltransferase involved in cell wall biosynthesis